MPRPILPLFLVLFFAAPFAFGQDDAVVEQGIKPYGSYHGGDIDSVSMANVRPTINIPLISYPQRGGKLKLGFSVALNVPSVRPLVQCYTYKPYTCYQVNYIWNWNYSWQGTPIAGGPSNFQGIEIVPNFTPTVGCFNFTNGDPTCPSPSSAYRALDSDGAVHQLGQLASGKYISMDATGYTWDSATGILIDRIGTRSTSPMSTNGQRVIYPASIEDANGNKITTDANPVTGAFTKYLDTLGRSIPATTTATTDYSGCKGTYPTASAVLWSPPGPSGGASNFKVCFGAFPSWIYYPPGCTGICSGVGAGNSQIQSIVLPNGTAWTFEYDINGTGFLNKIVFPTGGSVSYTWIPSPLSAGPPVHFWYPYAYAISSRTVDANDGTGPHTWNYSQRLFSGYYQTIATDPQGNDAVHTMTNLANTDSVYETQVDRYQGSSTSGTLLETILTDYNTTKNPYDWDSVTGVAYTSINVVPTHITTKYFTGANTQVKRIEKDYDTGIAMSGFGAGFNAIYGNVIAQREYDYGSGSWGPLLRQTKTTYQAFSGPNASFYLANNLLALPYSTQILNGSGSQVAYTQYGYDESSLGSSGVGSTEQHDTAPPAGTYRGNQTSVLRWLNSGTLTCPNGHSGGSGSNVISKLTYFDTGTLQSSADPCGDATTFAYSSAFWGALPTTVSNPLSQPTSNNYDFNTGLLTSSLDPNNLTTSFSYDSMWRLASATHPDGEVDTITHQESSYPFSSTINKTINATKTLISTNVFDGLGRVTQSQLNSDPQGVVYTDTTYDTLGRVSTVSNPHRNGSDVTTTSGTTTYGYDALNRKTSETYPDTSVLTTAYCGASTLVTDPTQRWRRSRVDGLGHLVEVDEPNSQTASVNANGCPGTGEPIWITSYTNDALGNLTQIVQNGSHTRAFTYDSLSRMLTSSNPEVGTITYTYSPDGTALTKTDARAIVSSYTYDALHREKAVSYSNGDAGISINYDESTCLTGVPQCNNIGQRTSMTDAAGSEVWAYDVPDRIHKEQRTTSGITKSTTYNLDYSGNIISVVYPTGRTINYTYDAADRPITAADSANGITYATGLTTSPGTTCLANVTCYTPQGAFYSLSIGQTTTFTGLNLTHNYNSRLQPNEFKASSSAGNAIDVSYSFADPLNSNKDAGHVFSVTNNLDTTRSQSFTYDQVNRITAAQTTSTYATSPGHCWGETYNFDAWANLQSIAATTNTNYTGCTDESGFSHSADGNNHLTGFIYDAAGNTSNDTVYSNYVWDGESQLKSAAGVSYLYDGDGLRAGKVGSKLYWYGSGGEILAETDSSGNITAEYIFFGGKRIAMLPANAAPNGGFEQGLQSWTAIGAGISLVTDPIRARSGNNYVQMSTSTSAFIDSNQYIPVVPGQQITFGGWGYRESGASGGVTWALAVYDVNKNPLSYLTPSPSNVSAAAWTFQQGSVTIQAGAAYALLYAQVYQVSSQTVARFDDGFVNFGSSGGSGSGVLYYIEDLLGTSRVITGSSGAVCYDADFYPYGGERPYTNSCSQNYKFEGKERDAETGNDDFGARYYSNRFGRWLSADWSNVPAPVPYANLANPQTLNLYSMVADDPESFADLDGHCQSAEQVSGPGNQCEEETAQKNAAAADQQGTQAQRQQSNSAVQFAKDEAIGMGKELANTVISVTNLIDGGINALLGTNLHTPEFNAATQVQKEAMAGTSLALFFIPESKVSDGAKLAKSLASEAQMAEKGIALAGAGAESGAALRDAPRLAAQYGGKTGDWAKMGSKSFQAAGDTRSMAFETHWYQNVVTGAREEFKTIMNWMKPDFKP